MARVLLTWHNNFIIIENSFNGLWNRVILPGKDTKDGPTQGMNTTGMNLLVNSALLGERMLKKKTSFCGGKATWVGWDPP